VNDYRRTLAPEASVTFDKDSIEKIKKIIKEHKQE